ncbi:MAG: hypothetical protein M3512_06255 [Bacteroidota bacterium]|nr:hypothetical protein [Bacteroidota bacterium]
MGGKDADKEGLKKSVMTVEQEEILELYITHLDNYLGSIKDSERLQATIETLHLKKILAK